MIYRVHHDDRFLMYEVPAVEAMNKLGEEYGTFSFNAEPIPYKSVWKTLTIEFKACTRKTQKIIPDISENFGRLFLSKKAHTVLQVLLNSCGEFLPVIFDGGQGYIFNPLKTAEKYSAINEELLSYDEYGNLVHFAFHEIKLTDVPLFKTKLDTYTGIFCLEKIKSTCEDAGLTGVFFHPDISNPVGEPYSTAQ